MKFLKGMIVGGMIAAGTAMMCADRNVCKQEKNDENGKTICKKNGNDVEKEVR